MSLTKPNDSGDESLDNETKSIKSEVDSDDEENNQNDNAESENAEEEEEDEDPEAEESVQPPKVITYDCSMCFFTSDNDNNFVKHIEELHRRDMGFWCKACGSAYESSSQLIEHIREFCDKIKHYQHICGFSSCEFKTNDPANLIFHFRNEHKGKYLFPCGQCEQQFTILTSLVLHQQQKCSNKDMCALLSSSADLARKKVNTVKKEKELLSNEKRFRCALCTFETTQKSMFVEHQTELHMRDLCCCKRCGKVFKNPDNLGDHIDDDDCHSNQFKHPCGNDECDFETFDPLAYRNHIRNGHTRTSLHKCDGCKKQFTIIPLLLMHIQEECTVLNMESRGEANSSIENREETKSSNGKEPADTIQPFAENTTESEDPPARPARKAQTARRGGGAATRKARGRAAAAAAPAGRVSLKRGRSRKTRGSSSDESDADEPEPVTPSRSSSRVAAKKVSYTHSSNSEEDY